MREKKNTGVTRTEIQQGRAGALCGEKNVRKVRKEPYALAKARLPVGVLRVVINGHCWAAVKPEKHRRKKRACVVYII